MFRCVTCGAFNRVREPRPQGTAECGRCHGALDVSGAPQEVNGEALDRAILARRCRCCSTCGRLVRALPG
ncbi:hypothetical protein ACLESD_50840, partial [Pyxidicoccus sp. 3LFB2]